MQVRERHRHIGAILTLGKKRRGRRCLCRTSSASSRTRSPALTLPNVPLNSGSASRWSLYWADTWHAGLCPPLVGGFEDGLGEFLGDDEHEGRPVRARFLWSGITERTARWEQAFSTDGGESWEVNWTMDFERLGDEPRAE